MELTRANEMCTAVRNASTTTVRMWASALRPRIRTLGPRFVGASDKESIAEIRSLEAKYGEAWTDEWLASRGLTLRDYGPYDEVTA